MLFIKSVDRKYMLGFDLQDDFCQISYCIGRADPVTLSLTPDREEFDIPTLLCRKQGTSQWYCGRDAAYHAGEGEGELVSHILESALYGGEIEADGERFSAVSLLALFIRRCLALLETEVRLDEISAIMFTSPVMDERMVEVLQEAGELLALKDIKLLFEDHSASFYNYMLYQDDSLRSQKVYLFEQNAPDRIDQMRLIYNPHTVPVVGYVENVSYTALSEDPALRDREFYDILYRECSGQAVGSAFLLGEGFKDGWMRTSLSYLCRGRRVFQGNNLFSKGAAYGALERMKPSSQGSKFFFLGENKLKTNIGLFAVRGEEESYHAILDAGVNWYEAQHTEDFILEEGNEITLTLRPLNGGEKSQYTIRLDELPVRPSRTTRIRASFSMRGVDRLFVEIADLGFGEIFPSSGIRWEKELRV